MKIFKVGIIGLGNMGTNHYRVLNNSTRVEIVGVFDIGLKNDHNFKPDIVCRSIKEIINKNPDYCVIATPTHTHEEISMQLIKNGVNFLVEKPISMNYESANKIHKATETNSIAAVGHVERHNSAVIEAKKLIEADILGNIFQIATRRQGPKAKQVHDIGVVKDLATHDIDATRWILNSEYDYCYSEIGHDLAEHHEDKMVSIGRMTNGVLYNHIVNWTTPFKERKMIITGEKGVFEIDMLETDLVHYENGIKQVNYKELTLFKGASLGNIINFAFEKNEPLYTEHLQFQDLIENGSSNSVSLRDGVINLQVAESFLESARNKKIVKMNYDN